MALGELGKAFRRADSTLNNAKLGTYPNNYEYIIWTNQFIYHRMNFLKKNVEYIL